VENKKRTAEDIAVGNKKRTAKGIAVGNKKHTSAKRNKEYQKHTPEQTDAAELRLQEKRADKRELDDKNHEKLLVELRAGMEVLTLTTGPTLFSKTPPRSRVYVVDPWGPRDEELS
jgi:hypothetical protein